MKKYILFILVLACCLVANAQEQEKYSMIELRVSNPQELEKLAGLGLPLDCSGVEYLGGEYLMTVPVTAYDLSLLQASRIAYRVTIEDAKLYYMERNSREEEEKAEEIRRTLGNGMPYGANGGYFGVAEIEQQLDALYNKYGSKNLITKKISIGKSVRGKDIYMVKISDNAASDEAEPKALYTALTHAREPAGMMALFYFMYHLLENYGTDQRATNIVNGKELYFVPCLNPDGYSSNGYGGMTRKNANGVDLNRNYGDYELWNYPNNGSGTTPSSQTYRGTAPFSEPETKAMETLGKAKKFKTALHYHTYSNLLIYPWGTTGQIAEAKFRTMAMEMTRTNGYRYGTAAQLLYAVRGTSDDWFWKVCKTYAMTPEVGSSSDGFWPSKARIIPLAKDNLEANLLLAEYAQ